MFLGIIHVKRRSFLKYFLILGQNFKHMKRKNKVFICSCKYSSTREVQCAGRHILSDTVDRQVDGDLGESADAIRVNNGPSISHWSLSVAPDSQMLSHTERLTFFSFNCTRTLYRGPRMYL